MKHESRRNFLLGSAALAAGAVASRLAYVISPPEASAPAGAPAPTPLIQFAYSDVQLLDGPMAAQFRSNHALFLNLSEDSMLKPFRQLVGLPAPGEDMGGWYSPSKLFNPPTDLTGYIPGHSFGQYLSGLARAYAVTGDAATRAKVHRLVQGFAATISPKFYDGYCLPAYTFDKTVCGLMDAHAFSGDRTALSVLDHATDAALPWLPAKALNREEMSARPHPNISYTWDESYTLPENLYLAYQRGAGTRYRQLAQRFLEDNTYFTPLANGRNVLPGQHAYSHLNALCSAMQAYLVDGSQMHLRAASNGFRFVREQSFVTGGWGPNETFQQPGTDDLAGTLHSSHNSFETPCGAYGHFKMARYLMRVTEDPGYGDSMEAILYNTILGARPIRTDGVSFYYSDYNTDAVKADYGQKWPCCSGTFPQLTADYGISSYLRSPSGIHVNLYVPSVVRWKLGNARVALTQRTSYPYSPEIHLAVSSDRDEHFTIALRIPAWAGAGTTIKVNGAPSRIAAQPGSWAKLERTWRQGDTIELALEMKLRLVPLDDRHANLVALVHGPVALFAIDPGEAQLTREQLLAAEPSGAGSADWHVRSGAGTLILRPFPAITTERYRLYHQT